jgi:tRNA(Ile)-lysidine synthase TilS/MesJ
LERHPPITQISRISLLLNLINPINLRRKRLFLGALIPMKICTNCVLPETFPGISFDAGGRCSFCQKYRGSEAQEAVKDRFKEKFLKSLEGVRGKGSYDALAAYSGGKDSTFTLMMLKQEVNLKVLAITLDHGFVSPTAVRNIQHVTGVLDMDHLMVRPGAETLRTVFRGSMEPGLYPMKALERASGICNSCMNLVKSLLLKTAIEMHVPMVVYGWSPGQAPVQSSVFKTNAPMIRQMHKAMTEPIRKMVGERLSGFLLEEHHFEKGATPESDRFPYLVNPLAFTGYSEERILEEIRKIGWVDPKDTDANSTNCLLNSFSNEVHLQQYGFHPYAFEIAGLVREGYMTREEGLKKLAAPSDPKIVEYVKTKLGIRQD